MSRVKICAIRGSIWGKVVFDGTEEETMHTDRQATKSKNSVDRLLQRAPCVRFSHKMYHTHTHRPIHKITYSTIPHHSFTRMQRIVECYCILFWTENNNNNNAQNNGSCCNLFILSALFLGRLWQLMCVWPSN